MFSRSVPFVAGLILIPLMVHGDPPPATAKKPAAPPALVKAAPPVVDNTPIDPFSIATDKIRDLSTVLVVLEKETNKEELEKIGGSFKPEYFFRRMNINYKQPNKVRLEAKVIGLGANPYFRRRYALRQSRLQAGHQKPEGRTGAEAKPARLRHFCQGLDYAGLGGCISAARGQVGCLSPEAAQHNEQLA